MYEAVDAYSRLQLLNWEPGRLWLEICSLLQDLRDITNLFMQSRVEIIWGSSWTVMINVGIES
jgi:hypothetical protein